MNAAFLWLLEQSAPAAWLILAVLPVRLLLKKAPKKYACLLWALAAVRLICPFSIESSLSLVPKTAWVREAADFEAQPPPPTVNAVDVDAIREQYPDTVVSVNVQQPEVTIRKQPSLAGLLPWLWLAGMLAMLGYALVGYGKLRKSVAASVPAGDSVFLCDEVQSPFLLGVLRPRIYVPSSLTGDTLRYVIRHEEAHIRRKDHWWKPLGYLLLCVWWFHPLVWLGYILFCRDVELACDESVVRDMDDRSRAGYSQALLDCAVPRRRVIVCPVAFGEVGVKARVKNVLRYRKPAFWLGAAAAAACIIIGVCFLTEPNREPDLSFLNYENAVSAAGQRESIDAILYPFAPTEENGLICIGTAEGNALARYLESVSWKQRTAPGHNPASPGSVEFILNDDYRITVYQKPRAARVTSGADARWYRVGRSDFEAAAALFRASGEQRTLETAAQPKSRNKMTLPELLALEGVWTCDDGGVRASFTADEDRAVTGSVQKDGKTLGFSLEYRYVKGNDRRAVCRFVARTDGETDGNLLCEARMQAKRGKLRFTPDEAGKAWLGRKTVDFSFTPSVRSAAAPEKWFDFYDGDDVLWDEVRVTTLPEFPGVTFRCSSEKLEAVKDGETVTLYYGMPIMSVYFCDLNGDGMRELCSTVSYGSGIVDEHITVFDYASGAEVSLWDRGTYDYRLSLRDGQAWAEKRPYSGGGILESGPLTFREVVGTEEERIPTLMLAKSS